MIDYIKIPGRLSGDLLHISDISGNHNPKGAWINGRKNTHKNISGFTD